MQAGGGWEGQGCWGEHGERQTLLSGPTERGRTLDLSLSLAHASGGTAQLWNCPAGESREGSRPGGVWRLRALGGREERLGLSLCWPLLVRMGLELALREGDSVGYMGRRPS